MRTLLLLTLLATVVVINGCGKNDKSSSSSSGPAKQSADKPAVKKDDNPANQSVTKPVTRTEDNLASKSSTTPPDQAATQISQGPPPVVEQNTPEETLKAFVNCYTTNDLKTFMSLAVGNFAVMEALTINFEYTARVIAALKELEIEVIKIFGTEAWSKFINRAQNPAKVYTNMQANIDALVFEMHGDEAVCHHDDVIEPFAIFRRQDGKWYIDVNEMYGLSDTQQIADFKINMTKTAEAINQVRRNVGQPGITLEILVEELDKKIKAITVIK